MPERRRGTSGPGAGQAVERAWKGFDPHMGRP
jgi:hypothetical protein